VARYFYFSRSLHLQYGAWWRGDDGARKLIGL
jgi:hypothetical protein